MSAEPIIPGPKAVTCLGLNVLAAALAVRQLWPLAHRAYPKRVFLSTGSAMHFIAQRCKLLLVCAVLHSFNSISFTAHYAIAYSNATYNALVHRMVHAISGQPVIVLVSLATLQRCFALVVLDGDTRAKRLRTISAVFGLLLVANTCIAGYWAFQVHTDASLRPADRIEARYLPSWAFLPATCAPLVCMVVCVWSTFKLRGRHPPGSGQTTSPTTSVGGQASSRGMRSLVRATLASAPLGISPSADDSVASSARRHGQLVSAVDQHLAAKGSVLSSSSTGRGQQAMDAKGLGRSPYPIKRSLSALNYCISAVWILYAATVLLPTQLYAPTPLNASALVMLYMSVIVALESSFEKLVKRYRKRRQPAAEAQDPGWGMGGAMSVMEHEPVGSDTKSQALTTATTVVQTTVRDGSDVTGSGEGREKA